MPIATYPPASTGGGGTTTNAVTFNNGGAGAASGTTFDGSVARTISTNTIGAYPTSNPSGYISSVAAAWPVGAIFISVDSTNPGTSLGFGTWVAFGAGRVLVGLDSGDPDFDTSEETGGAKTVASAGSVAAPTISGSTAAEAAHTHSVTSNVSVADHAAHTHSVTSNVAVGDHASHTHTYTDVPNHTHPHNMQGGTTAATTGTNVLGSTATGGSARAMAIATSNPTGGVATGTTAGPSATLTHSVTNNAVTSGNPSATLTHAMTNAAVTSAAGSSHSHAVGTLAASAPAYTGSSTSVVQPYIVVYMFKRTA